MADKNKLKKISAELKKASKMHAAQAKKIENISKGPSMINIAGAVAGLNNQKKSTAVGSVSPHSHDSSKDNAQPIPPITPPMPDNITGNIGNNFKVQELGKSMFQGEEMANQFAQRQMDKPVPPPGDPIGDQLGNMFMQPFNNGNKKVQAEKVPQKPKLSKQNIERVVSGGYEKVIKPQEKVREMPRPINMNGDPKGRPYVVNKEKTGTSKDTLFLDKDVFVSKSGLAEDSDIDNAARKAAAKGIYNYMGGNKNFNFEYLEESGKVKYKI
jgi:hypothetical protein